MHENNLYLCGHNSEVIGGVIVVFYHNATSRDAAERRRFVLTEISNEGACDYNVARWYTWW